MARARARVPGAHRCKGRKHARSQCRTSCSRKQVGVVPGQVFQRVRAPAGQKTQAARKVDTGAGVRFTLNTFREGCVGEAEICSPYLGYTENAVSPLLHE